MTSHKSFVDVPFPDDKLRSSASLRDYMLFIANSDYLDVNFLARFARVLMAKVFTKKVWHDRQGINIAW